MSAHAVQPYQPRHNNTPPKPHRVEIQAFPVMSVDLHRAACACGWMSARYFNEAMAVLAGERHVAARASVGAA